MIHDIHVIANKSKCSFSEIGPFFFAGTGVVVCTPLWGTSGCSTAKKSCHRRLTSWVLLASRLEQQQHEVDEVSTILRPFDSEQLRENLNFSGKSVQPIQSMCQDWSLWTSLWPGSLGLEGKQILLPSVDFFWLRYGKLIQAQLVNLKALSHPLHCHTHVFARRSLWHKPLPVENKNAHKIKPILLSWYWNYAQWSTWSSLGKVLHHWFMHCNWAEFLTRQGNLAWRVICLQDQCSTKVYKVTPLLESSDIGVIRHWSH